MSLLLTVIVFVTGVRVAYGLPTWPRWTGPVVLIASAAFGMALAKLGVVW